MEGKKYNVKYVAYHTISHIHETSCMVGPNFDFQNVRDVIKNKVNCLRHLNAIGNPPINCYINGVYIAIPAIYRSDDISDMINEYTKLYNQTNHENVMLPLIEWWIELLNDIKKNNSDILAMPDYNFLNRCDQDNLFLLELAKKVQEELTQKQVCLLTFNEMPEGILKECIELAHMNKEKFPKHFRIAITPNYVGLMKGKPSKEVIGSEENMSYKYDKAQIIYCQVNEKDRQYQL